ncbi:hypothetical protein L6R50_16565 [Myxococcota bacterium]|nr:hypothetical protein [Myxococcota bacterium]
MALLVGAICLGTPQPGLAAVGGADCRPTRAETWRESLDGAMRLATETYDPGAALRELRRLRADLACLRTPVRQEDLGRVFLYEGATLSILAAAAEADRDSLTADAREAFATGVSLFSQVTWDAAVLGTTGEASFRAVKAEVEASPPDATLVVPPSSDRLDVLVDGQSQGRGWDTELRKRHGFHLVQLIHSTRRGEPSNHPIELRTGERVVLDAGPGGEPSAARRRASPGAPLWTAAGACVMGTAALFLGSTAELQAAYDSRSEAEYQLHRDANHALFTAGIALGSTAVALAVGGIVAATRPDVRVGAAFSGEGFAATLTVPVR